MSVALLAALTWKVVDFLKALTHLSDNKNIVVTQAITWGVTIVFVMLGAHAMLTENIVIPGTSTALGTLDGASLVFAGLLLGSAASASYDLKRAIDGSDSAVQPKLLD